MSRYIDAERLKQILKPKEWGTPDERWIPEHEIGAMLDYFPAADVQEVKHGRWIEADDDGVMHKCSVCGEWSCCCSPYCGECGAKMDGEEQE